jgi:hypothetical protein
MAKRYEKAKSAKRAKAGKKAKTARKTKAVGKTKAVKKTKAAKRTKTAKKTKTVKKPRRFASEIAGGPCESEQQAADAAQARVSDISELLRKASDEDRPGLEAHLRDADTALGIAQNKLDRCLAGVLLP